MATLQKIRNRGVLLAIIIGGALFLFVIGDFLNSGSTLFHQSRNVVGDIAGETIKYDQFQTAVDQLKDVYQIEFGNSDFDDQKMTELRNSVWNNFVNERLITLEAKKVGITVSDEELLDRMTGKNIHPLILQRRVFMGQNGQFSREALMQFYNSIFNNPNAPQSEEQSQQLELYKNYWMFWEKAVKNAILQEKYMTLIAKSTGSNSIEAKYNYEASKMTGDVNYVVQPYFSVSDSSIQVSKDEISKLYEKRKEGYKQDPNRSINYVAFAIKPLAEDYKKGEEWIAKYSEEFKTTDDVEDLVNTESDITYSSQPYSMQTVPANLKDFAFSSSTGAIYGPVYENDTYTMAKVTESGIMESDSAKLSMIVVANETAADSLIKVINSGANFADIANKNSLAIKNTGVGGDIGWVNVLSVGNDLQEKIAANGAGGIFKNVMPQGVQIFKINEKTPARRKVKLAILQHKITPSSESQNKIYNEAKQFAIASKGSSTNFDKAAKEKKYIVTPATNITENTVLVNAIPDSRSAVKWALTNSKNHVSDVIECGSQNFIVATVTDIYDKGYKPLSEVESFLKAEIIKDKKAEKISKDLSGLLAKNGSLDGLATAMNTTIKTAPAINFNSYTFGDAGFEPYIIGKSSITPAGKISQPLKGEAGVYVIVPAEKMASSMPYNALAEEAQLDAATSMNLPYQIVQKLKDNYKIKDNRANFY